MIERYPRYAPCSRGTFGASPIRAIDPACRPPLLHKIFRTSDEPEACVHERSARSLRDHELNHISIA